MNKTVFFIFIANLIIYSSCSQSYSSLGPGYNWDLFKNTKNAELAKAVAKEDTSEIITIIKSGKADINLQEPKFRRTILMLAVGNDKELSTDALLKMGANINLRDDRDDQAIHEAVAYLSLKKHSLHILKMLLAHGADPNSISRKGSNDVPLQGAIEDSACARLLIQKGANIYFRSDDSSYVVWSDLTSADGDALFLAKDLIITQKYKIPNPILYTYPNHYPRSFIDLLEISFVNNQEKDKIKNEIINYLIHIGFPKQQVYQN